MRFAARVVRPGSVELVMLERDGIDAGDVIKNLALEGFSVLSVKARRGLRLGTKTLDIVLFTHELAVLLRAGIGLHDALAALAEKETGEAARGILARLRLVLREGRPFSTAVGEFPDVFPPLYVANMRASERTGDLATALERFVEFEQRVQTLRRKISGALIYPAILMAAGFLVMSFLMLYVVPRFSRIQEGRNTQVSDLVGLLFAWGKFAAENSLLVTGVALAGVAGMVYLGLSGALVRKVLPALLMLRPFRDKLRLFYLITFYRTVGMLIESGISVINAVSMSVATLSPQLQGAAQSALRQLREGTGLVPALEQNHLLTGVSARLVAAGAAGGRLAEMLGQSADFHAEELTRWIESFTKVFEPVVMALIGLVVGAVVVVMYMPIFELAGGAG